MEEATMYRCGICLESVNEPRALPCLHSFCTDCLRGLCEAEQSRCPECRKAFSFPVGGVEDFPVNFYLKLASVRRRSVAAASETCFQCNTCRRSPVTLVDARDCAVYCGKCAPVSESVVLVEDSCGSGTLDCPHHPPCKLELYCAECRVLACSACLQTRHADHRSVDVARVSGKVRADLRAALGAGLRDRSELLALQAAAERRAERLQTARVSALSSVNDTFSQAEQILVLHKQCLLGEIETSCERDLVAAEQGKEEAASLLAELDRVLARTSSLLDGPSLSAVAQSSVLGEMKQAFVRCDGVRHTLRRLQSQDQDGRGGIPSAHQLQAMVSAIQKRCIDAMLSPSQPFPPNCRLVQPAPMPLLPRKEYMAVLSCYSGWMTPVTIGKNQLSVELFSEDGVRGDTRLEQKENAVAVTFSVPGSGMYHLSVRIDGAHVEGSPATVYVQRCCTGASALSHTLHTTGGPAQYSRIAVGGEGDIAAANVTQGTVDLFDSRGLFLKSVKNDRLTTPGGLCMDPFGNVFVVDAEKKCVRRFSRSGHYIGKVGSYGPKSGQMVHPTDIAAGHDGSIYVVDSAKDRIFVFSQSGTLQKEIGGYGSGPLRFKMPTSIAISSDNKLLVADSGNKRIQVLSAEGEFLYFFGRSSEDQGKMSSPHRLSVARDGTVVVTEKESSTALMFSDRGEYICSQQFPQSAFTSKCDLPISVVPNGKHELLVVSQGYSGIAVYS